MTAEVWRLPRADGGYPAPLHDLDEPPAALHGIGDANLVRGITRESAVTIVGSRHPSAYGLEVAGELGYLLAGAGRLATNRRANADPELAKRSVTDLQVERHIRNIYKVLLTRGMTGTIIYATDPHTQEFLAHLIP